MKKLLSVFLCVMMVLLMSVTPAALAQEEELSKDVTINVYSWWDPTKVGMVNLKDGFEKKYADYNVKLNFVKISEYYKTMLTKLAGIRLAGGSSEAIDVMMIAFDKIPQFAANNTLMQLDAFASQEYLDSLYPSVREGLYFDGHLYATARDVTANCAILNTALFEKYNIELPAEDWTMDDFLALCRQFAKPEDGVWGYAIDGYSDTMYPWMYLFGADYMDRITHTSLLDQPNQLKGFTTLYQLIEDGACMSVAQTNEFGGVTSAFATNHAAMLFGGLSKANGISDMTDDFIVMPLPTGASNEKQSHIFCNCWAIPTVSTQPAWAWKVIEYFSSMEGQTIACNAEMGLPATPAADTTEWVAAKPWRKYYLDALGYEKSQPYPVDTYGPNWDGNFSKLLNERVWDVRGMDVETLQSTIKSINELLTYYLQGGV